MTTKLPRLAIGTDSSGGLPSASATVITRVSDETHPPLAVGVLDGAKMVGAGRSYLYELMGNGELPFVRLGKRRLLLITDLADLLQRHRSGDAVR